MSLIQIYEPIPPDPEYGSLPVQSRAEVLSTLKNTLFDLLIVGGGVNGATIAHRAACLGLRTALVEQDDYGSEADLRAPFIFRKEVLRKELKPLWFWQRRESCRYWQHAAAALLEPHALPVTTGNREQREDGTRILIEQGRLARELILAARQEGATALNHVKAISASRLKEESFTVGCTDKLVNETFVIHARKVINATGINGQNFGRVVAQGGFQIDTVIHRRFTLGCEIQPHEIQNQLQVHSSGYSLVVLRPNPMGDRLIWELIVSEKARDAKALKGVQPHSVEFKPFVDLLYKHLTPELAEFIFSKGKDFPAAQKTAISFTYGLDPRDCVRIDGSGVVHAYLYSSFLAPSGAIRALKTAGFRLDPLGVRELKRRSLPRSAFFLDHPNEPESQQVGRGAVSERLRARLGALTRLIQPGNRGTKELTESLLREEALLYIATEQVESLADLLRRFGSDSDSELVGFLRRLGEKDLRIGNIISR